MLAERTDSGCSPLELIQHGRRLLTRLDWASGAVHLILRRQSEHLSRLRNLLLLPLEASLALRALLWLVDAALAAREVHWLRSAGSLRLTIDHALLRAHNVLLVWLVN